jgi:hypothetical protein
MVIDEADRLLRLIGYRAVSRGFPTLRGRRNEYRGRKEMTAEHRSEEGFIPFGSYKVWYRIVGDKEAPGKAPLLCLHGGPGSTLDYLGASGGNGDCSTGLIEEGT